MKKFLRLGANSRHLNTCSELKIGVVDVPFDKGQGRGGVADGPRRIREAGLLTSLEAICDKVNIKDYGAIKYRPEDDVAVENMNNYGHVVGCCKSLSQTVEAIINEGRICLTLGGDHSIAVGSVHGHLKAKNGDVAVIWLDAHADLNTNRSTPSGNVHGMPLAILTKEVQKHWKQPLPSMDWIVPKLSLRNLVYIGLRSVDPSESLLMHNLGINYFDMFDIQRYGIDTVIGAALDRVDPRHNKSIHVSYDIDSLDPLEAPSTGTAVRGGLLLREGIHVMTTINKTGRLGAIDMVEVNPHIGSSADVDKTLSAAIHLIHAAFGCNRRGFDMATEERGALGDSVKK